MATPLSIQRAIDLCVRKAGKLKGKNFNLTKADDRQECEIEVSEIVNSLALQLDKLMNLIWYKFVENKDKKPNLYFPCCQNSEKFNTKLSQYRIQHISKDAPQLYQLLESIQPYKATDDPWLKLLKDIAAIRHDSFPEITPPSQETGFGIGKGQNVFIRSMTINNGVVHIDGDAWSNSTGKREPMRVEFLNAVASELRGTGKDAVEFVIWCSESASEFSKKIGVFL